MDICKSNAYRIVIYNDGNGNVILRLFKMHMPSTLGNGNELSVCHWESPILRFGLATSGICGTGPDYLLQKSDNVNP